MKLAGQYKISDFRKSFVLSRTFTLLIMAIIFSSVLILVWLNFMTKHFRNRELVEDLTTKAQILANEISLYESGSLSSDSFYQFLRTAPDLLDAGLIIDMNKDVNWGNVRQPSSLPWSKKELDTIPEYINNYVYLIQEKQKVVFTTSLSKDNSSVVFVGLPIVINYKDSTPSSVLGSVYIFKPLETFEAGSAPLIISFFASFLLTLSMMSFPAYYYITLIVRPLLQIRDVAKAISEGELAKRATVKGQSEFGELAASINNMANHLQNTIFDLEAESNRLQQVLNGLNEGIIAYTSKLELAHINPTFRQYFPSTATLELSSNLDKLPLDEIKSAIETAIEENTTQFINIPINERLLFGQLLLLNSAEGVFQGVVGLFRDVTKERELEQTRRDYVSNVSHELKTPLTAMRCMVEPIIDGLIKDPSQLQRYHQIIYDEVLRMARLIDDMLELSRLQSGKTTIEMEPFQAQTLLENLYAKFSTITNERNIKFALELPNQVLPLIYGNPDRIEQIIYIFLDNATKFTPADGEIILRAEIKDDRLLIAVQDNGKGISAEDKEHIFERFYKADKSHGSIGTGLGLSIVKEITEKTGENVWVESELDEGATFFLSIAIYNNQDFL